MEIGIVLVPVFIAAYIELRPEGEIAHHLIAYACINLGDNGIWCPRLKPDKQSVVETLHLIGLVALGGVYKEVVVV